MDTDDLEPRTKKPQKRNLEPLGVAELEAYIGELRDEITRVEADIQRKKKHLSAAEGLFKK
jgi:uncharacterized small protein (DUF1192 family)